jgi:hypothetical protein
MLQRNPMGICFLATGWTKLIVGCDNSCTVKAVSGMHVTPGWWYQNTTLVEKLNGSLVDLL